jgi:hypothetical protein
LRDCKAVKTDAKIPGATWEKCQAIHKTTWNSKSSSSRHPIAHSLFYIQEKSKKKNHKTSLATDTLCIPYTSNEPLKVSRKIVLSPLPHISSSLFFSRKTIPSLPKLPKPQISSPSSTVFTFTLSKSLTFSPSHC